MRIENVIDKTNQYIAKYQINSFNGVKGVSNNNGIMMTQSQNNFLKKGGGVGGGKTTLEIMSENKNQLRYNSK